jgi:hypothetical protein
MKIRNQFHQGILGFISIRQRSQVPVNPDCPLATLRSLNDRGSGGVGPKTGEPGAFSTGHGQHQAVPAGIVVPRATDSQHQAMEGGQRMLNACTQHSLAKQAHQVVSQHGKAQGGFRGPEVAHVEPKLSIGTRADWVAEGERICVRATSQ